MCHFLSGSRCLSMDLAMTGIMGMTQLNPPVKRRCTSSNRISGILMNRYSSSSLFVLK